MRIYSVMPSFQAQNLRKTTSSVNQTNKTTNSLITSPPRNCVLISFQGDSLHDVKHGLSVSVEDAYIGLDMYKSGGAGAVANQLPEALNKTGLNFNHTVPYYCHNNPKGGIKVLYIPKEYDLERLPDKMPENLFLDYPVDMSIEDIAKKHGGDTSRVKIVIQAEPQTVKNSKLKQSQYRILIPTQAAGTIQRIDENNLDQLKTISYKIFKMQIPKGKDKEGRIIYDSDSVLCVHTPDFAKFEKAYTYSPELKDHPHINLYTRDFAEAAVDSAQKLNTEEFNHLKPANVIGHCRTGFPVTEAVINRSQNNEFFRGFKVTDIFHNPMENYQGTVRNPLDFLRYKATAEDYQQLINMPEFAKLTAIDKHRNNLSKEESELVDKIIRPFLQYYVDDNGNYNHSITPLISRKINPENISVNHVSHTFANEVLELDDLARGLTSHFREADKAGDKIPGRPNGCNIDFMKINDQNATMGKDNGISANMKWYTPYDPKVDTGETIVAAKRKNTKALLDKIGKATKTRLDKISNYTNASLDDELNNLLYSKDLIKKNRYVLGGLSSFHPKDILWLSWGRSDAQKGYPILLEGFYRFLSNKDVPEEYRLHAKLFSGSGPEPWPMDDKGCGDFHKIKDIMYKIQTLDGGKYKLNVAYGNGFFPNRLVTCATYGMFTSTGEPQGLTVPESLQAGTPTGSINTGGAGDMIITAQESAEKANGFKTKHPYMQNVKDLVAEGDDISKLTGQALEDARFNAAADEVAKMFEEMARVYHEQPELYKQMAENAGRSEFDWHNNHLINNGRSTLQLYTEDAFEIEKGMEGRNTNPLKRLVGEFNGEFKDLQRTIVEKAPDTTQPVVPSTQPATNNTTKSVQKIRNKWTKSVIAAGVVIAALGTAGYLYVKRDKNNQNKPLNKIA